MAKEKKLGVVISGDADSAAKAAKKAREGLDELAEGAEKSGDRVGKAGAKSGEKAGSGFLSKLKDAGGQIGDVLSKGALAGGALVAGVLVAGFNSHLSQAADTRKMAASLGLSPEEAKRAGELAGDVYADAYGESFSEVSSTMSAVLASAGRDLPDDVLKGLTEQALTFADVFDQDVNRAVSSAGIAVKAGLAKDMTEALDLMTVGMQQMPVHLRDELLEASDEYGQFFSQLGFSGEYAFGLLAHAAQDGMYGIDKTGDALKELTIRATDMSQASQDAYAAAGLSAQDMSARFLAGGDEASGAFEDLVAGLLSIQDPVAQANAAIALFGTPLEDLGVHEIPQFLQMLDGAAVGLEDVAGAAEGLSDTMEGPEVALERFKRGAMQGLTEFIGGRLIPGLQELGEWLGPRVSHAVDVLAPKVEQVRAGFVAMWEGAQPFLIMMRDEVGPVLESVAALIVDVVGNVVGWFQENWPLISDTVITVMHAVEDVVNVVLGVVLWVWDSIGSQILDIVETAWNTIRDVIASVMTVISELVEFVMNVITGNWGDAWDNIKNIVGAVWDGIYAIVTGALDIIWSVLSGVGSLLWDLLAIPFGAAKDWIGGAIDGLVGFVSSVPGRIGESLANLKDLFLAPFRLAFSAVAELWNRTVGSISFTAPDWVPGIGGKGFSMPQIDTHHSGGVVQGIPGQEVLSWVMPGETVRTPAQEQHVQARLAGTAGAGVSVQVTFAGVVGDAREAGRQVVEVIDEYVRRGGRPPAAA